MSHLHLLNWGMGVESTAILVRWLREPESRPFSDCRQLIVVCAQTGDEVQETKYLAEHYLFPLLRQHNVRLVQLAKRSASKRDGYVILSDTSQPDVLHIEGCTKLSDHWLLNGTSQRLSRPHICAQRWKGEVLEQWAIDTIYSPQLLLTCLGWQSLMIFKALCLDAGEFWLVCQGIPFSRAWRFYVRLHQWTVQQLDRFVFGPYLGYSAEETKRSSKSDGYGCLGREYRYPLQEWGWTRQDCLNYLQQGFGVIWVKSACKQCPFQERSVALARYQLQPQDGIDTLLIERNALAFNPRLHLFSFGTAYYLMVKNQNQAVLAGYRQALDRLEWAIYHVRRIYKRYSTANGKRRIDCDRWVQMVATGDRPTMHRALRQQAEQQQATVINEWGWRFYRHRKPKQPQCYPAIEEFYVAAPRFAQAKCRNWQRFEQEWNQLTGTSATGNHARLIVDRALSLLDQDST
ncbi:hypothetical protein H6F67_25680 [Microcoleus sp. FACHB-1515]|uniref:hypothetical protein n=1 Tax=Cyanophyceae TaxID=3028117 RepID=UPI001689E2F9|nr:hypothetical protein [Microcoleus sp. FACHB-1515]MBD2093239.1 hypothetical protein [Microcoleus sp. FACHB-1515]